MTSNGLRIIRIKFDEIRGYAGKFASAICTEIGTVVRRHVGHAGWFQLSDTEYALHTNLALLRCYIQVALAVTVLLRRNEQLNTSEKFTFLNSSQLDTWLIITNIMDEVARTASKSSPL